MFGNKHHQLTVWIIFVTIICAYVLMAFKFPFAYIVATYEDLVGEWAQVFFFVATMILAIRISIYKSRYRWFFIVLAVACFYVAGEEISWGQRIFDIETPDFFKKHNLQKETNLHNFFTGPVNTLGKDILEYTIAIGLFCYGFLYPLLLGRRWRLALWFDAKGLPAPPLYLWPFFVTSAILELGPVHFNEAEIAEILIPAALSVMILDRLVSKSYQFTVLQDPSPLPAALSHKLAIRITMLFVMVLLLATGATWACYSAPHLKSRIESRYLNGVEKFAGRYKRYELWDNAIKLYQYVQRREPDRASLHRNLYRCYQQLNDTDKMSQHFEQAISIDLNRLVKKPDSITANVSLARSHRLAGQQDKAFEYLYRGLEVAKTRQQKRPKSSSTAYWLGKIYEMLGRPDEAYVHYQRAVELNPNKLKYRKALNEVRTYVDEEATEDSG